MQYLKESLLIPNKKIHNENGLVPFNHTILPLIGVQPGNNYYTEVVFNQQVISTSTVFEFMCMPQALNQSTTELRFLLPPHDADSKPFSDVKSLQELADSKITL